MANDEKLTQLIQGLHRRTLESKIHWERTPVKRVYLANFPEYAVRISAELPGPLESSASLTLSLADQLAGVPPGRNYYVRIYNSNGDVLEEITDRQFTKTPQFDPREVMMETYNEVRRQVMGTDQAIEALLKVLQ